MSPQKAKLTVNLAAIDISVLITQRSAKGAPILKLCKTSCMNS